jgi:hypothetical protein
LAFLDLLFFQTWLFSANPFSAQSERETLRRIHVQPRGALPFGNENGNANGNAEDCLGTLFGATPERY